MIGPNGEEYVATLEKDEQGRMEIVYVRKEERDA